MEAFNLCGQQGKFEFGLVEWHFVMELGEDYGWKPEGTVFKEPQELVTCGWSDNPDEILQAEIEDKFLGDYFSNSGQRVTAQDAKCLADAIALALDDIPNYCATKDKDPRNAMPRRIAEWESSAPSRELTRLAEETISAKEWFLGEQKNRLNEFVSFCRHGGFQIL